MAYNTKELLTDSRGRIIPQAYDPVTDNFYPTKGTVDGSLLTKPSVAYDSVDDMYKIKSMQKKFRDSFPNTSLDTNKWEVVQTGTGQTITVGSGMLTLATGTTANAETIILGKEVFTVPCRLMVGALLSQRIANQEFYVELVSVNPTTLQPDGLALASWYFDGTTNTNAKYQVQNGGMTALTSGAVTITATSGMTVFETELFADETWFHQRNIDSSAGRTYSFVRHQQIPDPNSLYKIRIRMKNLGTAPASNTNFQLQYATVMDYAELTAEITASRGSGSAGQGMPVLITNTVTANANITSAGGTQYTDTTTNLTSGATYTGTGRDASTGANNRFRVMIMHTAGLTPATLVYEQSTDNTTFRETHRIPIPSDGKYRTFDLPINLRYVRVKVVNGATAQTAFFLATSLVRFDGNFNFDKNLNFTHSTTALASSATFTGVTLDLGSNHSYNSHKAMVYTDQAGTLYLEQSRDGSTWRITTTQSVTAGTTAIATDGIINQYVRVRYVNGATLQTTFELTSILN